MGRVVEIEVVWLWEVFLSPSRSSWGFRIFWFLEFRILRRIIRFTENFCSHDKQRLTVSEHFLSDEISHNSWNSSFSETKTKISESESCFEIGISPSNLIFLNFSTKSIASRLCNLTKSSVCNRDAHLNGSSSPTMPFSCRTQCVRGFMVDDWVSCWRLAFDLFFTKSEFSFDLHLLQLTHVQRRTAGFQSDSAAIDI